MKILAIAKPEELLLSLPPEKQTQMAKESIEPTKKLRDKGKILAQYYSPTSKYVFDIVDYDDAGEWMKDLIPNPALTYYDQEVYPIVDLLDVMKEYYET